MPEFAPVSMNRYPLHVIETVKDYQHFLKEPKALLCMWFDWSPQSIRSRDDIKDWHDRWHLYVKSQVQPLYFLNGDSIPELFEWIRESLRETGGVGSIYLFKNQQVVESVRCIIDTGLTRISEMCAVHY
ncbi:MAG: hypothetical protein AB8C95_09790 [Phycisphaeraceae bacterium]